MYYERFSYKILSMEEKLDDSVIEALGITRPVYEEITLILGRLPVIDDISTLLAMWESNGKQQSLLGWLKGMRHVANPENYLYSGDDASHKNIKEPRVSDCIEIARSIVKVPCKGKTIQDTGLLLYMVGDVSSLFLDSDYSRQFLHISSNPIEMSVYDEVCGYISLILQSMIEASLISSVAKVSSGGLFASAVSIGGGVYGFDILTPREVRLDSFLFGEEPGRFIVALYEKNDDEFLLKLDEARLNCCFLGRVTKGRILVDGTDFGPVSEFVR